MHTIAQVVTIKGSTIQAPSRSGAVECSFDRVFPDSATQQDVFQELQPTVAAVLQVGNTVYQQSNRRCRRSHFGYMCTHTHRASTAQYSRMGRQALARHIQCWGSTSSQSLLSANANKGRPPLLRQRSRGVSFLAPCTSFLVVFCRHTRAAPLAAQAPMGLLMQQMPPFTVHTCSCT